MSGIIGHTTYAILAAKAAMARRLPVGPIAHQHFSSYLAGAYLGCDVQTLPEAVCVDTQEEVGYGTAPLEKSPITGGPVKPWKLNHDGTDFTPYDIHRIFYGRAHLVFGWNETERDRTIGWDELPHYLAATVADAIELFPPSRRRLAYLFGWVTHVVGDSLIKSIQPGITLNLLDGKYTSRNRPVQDLVSFHQIGREELGIDWGSLLADLADTPVEKIQPHYMRAAKPSGRLAWDFPYDWCEQFEPLLVKVLAQNRRYQRIRNGRLLEQMALRRVGRDWVCDDRLSRRAGGLSYAEMLEAARKAGFRHALWQIAERIADVFEQIVRLQPLLHDFPTDLGPNWKNITRTWRPGLRPL